MNMPKSRIPLTPFSTLPWLFSSFLLFSFIIPPQGGLGFKATLSHAIPKPGDTIELVFKASIPTGFHLYSEKSDCPIDDGPLRSDWAFEILPESGLDLVGKTYGVGDVMVKDNEIFKCSTGEFKMNCEFRQKLKITHNTNTTVRATYTGQKCSEDGTCFLVNESLTIPLIVP
jgi:hypothetical protein